MWISVDPMVEKTMDAYGYCYQNPINSFDPDGAFPILINGKVSNDSERASSSYWDISIRQTIKQKTGYDHNRFVYVDGDKSMWADTRTKLGREYAKSNASQIYAKLKESVKGGKITEQLQVFTHSRGSAYGEGYMEGLRDEIVKLAKADKLEFAYGENNIIEYSVNLAPHQSNSLNYEESGTKNVNVAHHGDPLSGNDANGNVINIHSQPPKRMNDQHGNATYNTELGFILDNLRGSTKSNILNRIRKSYERYDKTNACDNCNTSTVKKEN